MALRPVDETVAAAIRIKDRVAPIGVGTAPTAVAGVQVNPGDPIVWHAWCRRCPWIQQHPTQDVAFRYAERHACNPT